VVGTFHFKVLAHKFSSGKDYVASSITIGECTVRGNAAESYPSIAPHAVKTENITSATVYIIPNYVDKPTDITPTSETYTGEKYTSKVTVPDDAPYTVTQVTKSAVGSYNGTLTVKDGYWWSDYNDTADRNDVEFLKISKSSTLWEKDPSIENNPVPYGTAVDYDEGNLAVAADVEVVFYKADDVNDDGTPKENATSYTTEDPLDPGKYVAIFTATPTGEDAANYGVETSIVPFTVSEASFKVYPSKNYIPGYTMIYVFSQSDTTRFSYRDSETGETYEMYDIRDLGYQLYLNEKGKVGSLTQDDTYVTQYQADYVYAYLVKNGEYENIATNIRFDSEDRAVDHIYGIHNGPMDVNTDSFIELRDVSCVQYVRLLSNKEDLQTQLDTLHINMGTVFRADVDRNGKVNTVLDGDPILQVYLNSKG
jgi:hypothetical protein